MALSDDEFKKALAQCTPEDFRGKTHFELLTPEQKLEWLSSCAQFYYSVHADSV